MKTGYLTNPSVRAAEIYWPTQSFDPLLRGYKHLLRPDINEDDVSFLGPVYPYVYDLQESKWIYFSPRLSQQLGHHQPQADASGWELLRKSLHPKDRLALGRGYRLIVDFLLEAPQQLRNRYQASIDFRVRSKQGDYIRLLQIISQFVTDNLGHVVFVKGKIADISHWGKQSDPLLSINGPEDYKKIVIPDPETLTEHSHWFSKREKQILRMLASGFTSKKVAESLTISHHTVNTHRQNMLQRLGLNKTASLVHFAHRQGLI